MTRHICSKSRVHEQEAARTVAELFLPEETNGWDGDEDGYSQPVLRLTYGPKEVRITGTLEEIEHLAEVISAATEKAQQRRFEAEVGLKVGARVRYHSMDWEVSAFWSPGSSGTTGYPSNTYAVVEEVDGPHVTSVPVEVLTEVQP